MSRTTETNTIICPPTQRSVRLSRPAFVFIFDVLFRTTRISPTVAASKSILVPTAEFT
jgi:hypothetical protein